MLNEAASFASCLCGTFGKYLSAKTHGYAPQDIKAIRTYLLGKSFKATGRQTDGQSLEVIKLKSERL